MTRIIPIHLLSGVARTTVAGNRTYTGLDASAYGMRVL
jgi:hypothetical protein